MSAPADPLVSQPAAFVEEENKPIEEPIEEKQVPDDAERDSMIELGDELWIESGATPEGRKNVSGHGYVYYCDDDMIKVLRSGTDLVEIPLTKEADGSKVFDPELNITEVTLEKRGFRKGTLNKQTENDSFVSLFGFNENDIVQVYDNGKAVERYYRILKVDPTLDTASFIQVSQPDWKDMEEDPIGPIHFDFKGIQRGKGLDADVLFPVAGARPPFLKDEPQNDVTEQGDGDLSQEEEEEFFKLVRRVEIREKGVRAVQLNEMVWRRDEQAEDMYSDLLTLEEKDRQEKTTVKRNIHRTVELLLNLRDTLINYSESGTSILGIKDTSADTLLTLLEKGMPLSRPVLDVKKRVYVDALGEDAHIDTEIFLLQDAVKSAIQFMKKFVPSKEGDSGEQPALYSKMEWIPEWQSYVNQYMKTFVGRTGARSLVRDTDFFRRYIQDDGSARVPGFPKLEYVEEKEKKLTKKQLKQNISPDVYYINHKITAESFLSSDMLESHIFDSYERALGPRRGRPTTSSLRSDVVPIVENADSATIDQYIVFPYTTVNYLGAIHSGSVLLDSIRAKLPMKTMQDIMYKEGDGLSENEMPDAKTIFPVGTLPDSLGNISVENYLERIPVWNLKGYGDFEDIFYSYGLNQFELNKDQLAVLEKRVAETNARTVAAIRTLRERESDHLKELHEPEVRRFSDEEDEMPALMTKFEDLMKLGKVLSQLTPAYQKVDFVQFAYLTKQYSDYVTASLSGNKRSIEREKRRVIQDEFIERRRIVSATELKKLSEGDKPLENKCEHVKQLETIQRVRDTRIAMKGLVVFLKTYKGKFNEKTQQYNCKKCKKHLVCQHEILLLNEFLHPRDSLTLRKELFLGFMGGQFQGHHICKYCGQPIQEIDLDTHLEYNDSGQPISGRSQLIDEDSPLDLLEAYTDDNEVMIDFKIKTTADKYTKFRYGRLAGLGDDVTSDRLSKKIFGCARETYEKLGITPSEETYRKLVSCVNQYILTLPNRDEYDEDRRKQIEKKEYTDECLGTEKPGYVDYFIYLNRRLVLYIAAYILVDIQTHVPEYVLHSIVPDCIPSFTGFPMSDEETEREGISYVACAVSGIIKKEEPWSLTYWQYVKSNKTRNDYIARCLFSLLKSMKNENGEIQSMIQRKRYHLETVLGRSLIDGSYKEQVPALFYPVLMTGTEQSAAKAPVADDSPAAWIRKLHKEAKKHLNPNYIKQSPFSETGCCSVEITKPDSFWKEKELAGRGVSVAYGSRGSRIAFNYSPRPVIPIHLEAPQSFYPRVFLKVCFKGDRVGLPHEPGLTGVCPWCELEFPEDTEDEPLPDDKKKYDEWLSNREMLRYDAQKAALTRALGDKVEIPKSEFQTVLDESHKKYAVRRTLQGKKVLDPTRFIQMLRRMDPPPYDTWSAEVAQMAGLIEKLEKGADEQAELNVLAPFKASFDTHVAILTKRIGNPKKVGDQKDYVDYLKAICDLSPMEFRAQVETYFLTPFKRILERRMSADFKYLSSDYTELGPDHKKLLRDTILEPHYNFFNSTRVGAITEPEVFDLFNSEGNTYLHDRAEHLVNRLHAILSVLENFHSGTLGLRYDSVRTSLNKRMLLAVFADYVNMDKGQIQNQGEGIKKSYEVLGRCIVKYTQEAKKYSQDQIREAIAKRKAAETRAFIDRIANKTEDEKATEKTLKRLGIGERYQYGGTSAIYKHAKDFWSLERKWDKEQGYQPFKEQGDGNEYGFGDNEEEADSADAAAAAARQRERAAHFDDAAAAAIAGEEDSDEHIAANGYDVGGELADRNHND